MDLAGYKCSLFRFALGCRFFGGKDGNADGGGIVENFSMNGKNDGGMAENFIMESDIKQDDGVVADYNVYYDINHGEHCLPGVLQH